MRWPTASKSSSYTSITTGSTPEDIWEGGGLYTFDDVGTAPIESLASNNAGDNQDIVVEGLDINGDEVEQTITLNGTTRVPLATNLWRVNRMINDSSTSILGQVFCYTGTGTVPSVGDPEVRALIDDGNNQTLMAIYTIPKGCVGFLYRGEVGAGTEGGGSTTTEFADVIYKSRRYQKAFTIKKKLPMSINGNSIYQDKRSFPDIIPSLTDIKITVDSVSTTMRAFATFDILIVPETEFPTSYLQAIGQPGY